MKRLCLSACLLLATAVSLPAADNVTVTETGSLYRSVFGEIGGASSLIGVNYDQRFRAGSKWGFRAGLAYAAPIHWTQIFFYRGGENLLTMPLAVNVLVSRGANHFEAGLGFTPGLSFWHDDKVRTDFYSDVFVDLGYRYMNKKGFMFRAGISPAFSLTWSRDYSAFMLRPYVGFGYTFGR